MNALRRLTPARLWHAYSNQLITRPIRTKTATSVTLFALGDLIAQLGFEQREFSWRVAVRNLGFKHETLEELEQDQHLFEDRIFDILRMLRITSYGLVFGPTAHAWIGLSSRIKLSTKFRSSLLKVAIDCSVWSPFVCALFPTYLGFAEGKTVEQVHEKVKKSWLPTWNRAVFVFGPTQLFNFNFIPVTYQVLVLQSVGLCWNVYLSWNNNRSNKLHKETLMVPID